MKTYKIIEFPHFDDPRGETVPFELKDDFPFPVKRVYIVTSHDGSSRGGHAHHKEEEVFVAVAGSVKALLNTGGDDQTIILNAKHKGLYVPAYCWHEFTDFSDDCVLLAFSSTHYEGRDGYIEDKEKFLSMLK